MRTTRLSVLLAAATVLGCGDAGILRPDLPAACASPRACQVTGVDLVVDPPRFLVAPDHPRDAATGRLVFLPGESISYAVSVWNRGDTPSDSTALTIYPYWAYGQEVAAVPALAPGQAFTDTLSWEAPARLNIAADTTWLRAQLQGLQASEDPLNGNDWSDSDTVIIAVPVIHAILSFPDTAQAEVPFTATVTVQNLSRFADMTPRAMAFCLFDFDVGCGSWAGEPFQLTAVPTIAAGASWTMSLEVTIPDHSPYSPWDWHLYACFADAGTTLDSFFDWQIRQCVPEAHDITVLDPPSSVPPGGAS